MKRFVVKTGVGMVLMALVCTTADAQRAPKRRTGGTNPPATQQEATQNNTSAPAYNPNVTIPITFDTATTVTGGGKSLRNDNLFDKGSLTTRTPLAYDHIRWDDALFAEKVWRELDLREKMNSVFRYDAQDDNGSQLFIDILLKAVRSGEVTAFSDDRFTTPMSLQEIDLQTAGGFDTVDQVNIADPSKVDKRVVTRRTFDSKSVMKLRMKEEWVFDRESSRMIVRILGISPILTRFNENGTERGVQPMFWIYYPDLRATLTKYEVYNPKNMGQSRMTWEELFESRMFSSYITKSTIENPSNKNIRQYMKDPILALLEGDNIKEKIFNYEQDLWSY